LSRVVPGSEPLDPSTWAQLSDRPPLGSEAAHSRDYFPRVVTRSDRAAKAITTAQWFFVDDGQDQKKLFLKPDDRDDVNDVASRCRDVIEEFDAS
jgi:hypothetical protein